MRKMPRFPWMMWWVLVFTVAGQAQTTIPVPLSTSAAGKISLGFFAGGTLLQLTATGQGDLVSADFQTYADGSLAAVAAGVYAYANAGASHPVVNGGDGINHFVGGGSNYDDVGDLWGFAGLETTDTTNSGAIRGGALVATFSPTPSRGDWFLVGLARSFVVPVDGATLYVAVNDSFHGDNHGSYSLTYGAVPEPASAAAWCGAGVLGACLWRRRRRASS